MRDSTLDEILGSPDVTEIPFDSLMPRRVNNLLLVTSLYDCFTFIEDGRLSETLFSEYLDLGLRFAPSIERASTAAEALDRIRAEQFDLVISMPRVGEMNVREFCREARSCSPELPIVLLASNLRELESLQPVEGLTGIDKAFVWLGDVGLFLAIIKHVEDRLNAWHDARTAGVKIIILVEDSVQFYSSYLPMLYTEIVKQTQALIVESVNRAQRLMRQRARPKILLARTFEEGFEYYDRYRQDLLGVILDASFPHAGKVDPWAGFEFARLVRGDTPDVPVLMQSSSHDSSFAESLGLEFIDKNSPTLLSDLRGFMERSLGFGDFVFQGPDGRVVSRAADLRTLEWAIQAVPDDCLLRAADRPKLHTWLMARTEFDLARSLREAMEGPGAERGNLRQQLLTVLRQHRERTRAGVVAEFSSGTFEGGSGFVRIGKGSLGGKGRGLAFINSLINRYRIGARFPGVRISIPPTAVLATDVFRRFMEKSGLLPRALRETDDEKITEAFLAADLPDDVEESLWTFLDWVRYPLAVRSSSLLEDASYQPFAGIYETIMIPNNHPNPEVRLAELCSAIKRVYASTYQSDAKAYIESTPNRLEEEQMAIVLQQVVGRSHGTYVYPNFAGVGRSINFYPMPDMKPEDGVVSVALGLGKTVVEGGRCVRFCPAYPRHPIQSFTPQEYLDNSQRQFLALDLASSDENRHGRVVPLDIELALEHGTLGPVGSVYSAENDAVYDGLARNGVRLVTMAGVLKGSAFPLADIVSFLLKVGSAASSCPVEIEFAANLSENPGEPHEFAFLQIRPLVLGADASDVSFDDVPPERALCIAHKALGNGVLSGVRDVVYVRRDKFDRALTPQIARELGDINAALRQQRRPYLLIGPGRWGSSDPWLGVPVKWAQISGVRCIIETDLSDMSVDPSQGSHFFQNIVSFGIGYLTVNPNEPGDRLDLDWLDSVEPGAQTDHLRHASFVEPLSIKLNGRKNIGVVLKP